MNIMAASDNDTPQEIDVLRRKLNALLVDARMNEDILRRFQALELRLLSCRTIMELMQTLIHYSHRNFGWDAVTMTLLDSDYSIRHLLELIEVSPEDLKGLIFISDLKDLTKIFNTALKPKIGLYQAAHHDALFPSQYRPLGSAVILPLMHHGKLRGSLNLGSTYRDRFKTNMATDFLQHMAAVLSTCLDNAIAQEALKHAGLTDALTGVNNRRFFDQRLREEVERAERDNTPLCLLFIDIDNFKQVNDQYGHTAGDQVLHTTASLIRKQIRTVDIVARFGGEEFAVLLTQADETMAMVIAERIRSAIQAHKFCPCDTKILEVTVSIGIATNQFELGTSSTREYNDKLIEHSDIALYEAKRNGKNRIVRASQLDAVKLKD